MKHILLILTIVISAQLSANAQNQKVINQSAENKRMDDARKAQINSGAIKSSATKASAKRQAAVKPRQSEAQFISKHIKNNKASRLAVLANTVELKKALQAKFGDKLNLGSVSVASYLLKTANDTKQSVTIRREALKVIHGNIPAGHILEENK